MTNDEVYETIKHLIGRPYGDSIISFILATTDRKKVIGPNDISTREVDPERVQVQVDGAGYIYGFAFR